ncbi:hypothetical protein [Corallococcus sp. AB011P]|uniref:hypothetical protein n=1 Tax=Corallococcus sp. AB011P TaxID=2316735 RepID=UPI001F22E0C8|nr:hypothetical protein [Corallococcus sp. AB011P]
MKRASCVRGGASCLITGAERGRLSPRREALLQARIKDLSLRLGGTPLERYIAQLHAELEAKGISFKPQCYLSDEWGCPSGVPVIGLPFYLADPDLLSIEAELGGSAETEAEILMYLRHEAGHAFNYAYRLEVKFGPETPGSPHLVLPTDLSDELRGRLERAAITAFRALKLRDYARIDFRVSSRTNEPYLLEVNPNPYLETQCEVAMGAKQRGLGYEALVQRIVDTAARRHGLGVGRGATAGAPLREAAPAPH